MQHKIRDNSLRLTGFFKEHKDTFRIYIAGNGKNMPQSVEKAFVEIFDSILEEGVTKEKREDGERSKGQEMFDSLIKANRIQLETWI